MQRRRRLLQLLDRRILRVAPRGAAQRHRQRAVLRLQVVEHPGQAAERLRHLQQPQRVSGGRGVHHHDVEAAREPRQLDQRHQLVDPRQREPEQRVDVLVVEVGPARGDLPERPLARAQPAPERAVGVHLHREEPPRHHPRRRRQPHRQRVAERVGRIGRHHQRPRAPRRRQRRRRRAGGLPDSAFSRKEPEARHSSLESYAVASTPVTFISPASRRSPSAALPLADLAQAREHVALDVGELLLGDLAELEPHLGLEQPLAERASRRAARPRRPRRPCRARSACPPTSSESRINTRLASRFARSSLRRMLTKLYGGHGPVYLNVSLSNRAPIAFTCASNAASWSRETRNAAFMIILSPIGLFDARRDRDVAQRLEDLGHVPLRSRLQRGVDQPAVLHAREVGRPLLRRDLLLQPADVLVLGLDLLDRMTRDPTAP